VVSLKITVFWKTFTTVSLCTTIGRDRSLTRGGRKSFELLLYMWPLDCRVIPFKQLMCKPVFVRVVVSVGRWRLGTGWYQWWKMFSLPFRWRAWWLKVCGGDGRLGECEWRELKAYSCWWWTAVKGAWVTVSGCRLITAVWCWYVLNDWLMLERNKDCWNCTSTPSAAGLWQVRRRPIEVKAQQVISETTVWLVSRSFKSRSRLRFCCSQQRSRRAVFMPSCYACAYRDSGISHSSQCVCSAVSGEQAESVIRITPVVNKFTITAQTGMECFHFSACGKLTMLYCELSPYQQCTSRIISVVMDNGGQSWSTTNVASFNPLKPNVTMWLHFECLAPYRPNLPFLISDIRALWRSVRAERQSARMSEIKNGRLDLYDKV